MDYALSKFEDNGYINLKEIESGSFKDNNSVAHLAMESTWCAMWQKKFYQYYDSLYERDFFNRKDFLEVADEIELDKQEFERCVDERHPSYIIAPIIKYGAIGPKHNHIFQVGMTFYSSLDFNEINNLDLLERQIANSLACRESGIEIMNASWDSSKEEVEVFIKNSGLNSLSKVSIFVFREGIRYAISNLNSIPPGEVISYKISGIISRPDKVNVNFSGCSFVWDELTLQPN